MGKMCLTTSFSVDKAKNNYTMLNSSASSWFIQVIYYFGKVSQVLYRISPFRIRLYNGYS